MLANDIIALLSNESSSLSDALLKTKVFLHEIGKKELAEWVNHELNGYPDGTELPSYRILESRVMGDLMSSGWSASGQALPIQHLEPAYREKLEKSEMRESLALIEQIASKKQGSIRRHFPPEANAQLGSNLSKGWHVYVAWCEIGTLTVQNILVQVRSRLLDFMLELKGSVEKIGNGEINKANTAVVDAKAMFNSAIFGHNTTIILGDHNRQDVNASVRENDFEHLDGLCRLLASLRMKSLAYKRQLTRIEQREGSLPLKVKLGIGSPNW
jgi:AbiTii